MANYAAVCLLLLMWVLRFYYMSKSDEKKPEEYSSFWFFLVSAFQGCLIGLLAASMYPDKEHRVRVNIRRQFRFLDYTFGRGFLIFYLAICLCEVSLHGEVLYAVIAILIAFIDMY